MKILMASSECFPFVKVGGLADIVGSLPEHIKNLKNDVRVILPQYSKIDAVRYNLKILPFKLKIPLENHYETVTISEGLLKGKVPIYFIEHELFNRPGIYGEDNTDYPDNNKRFILFCRAVLEAIKALNFQPDIIHCHDWQTGLIPAYLKTLYLIDAFFAKTSTVFTIHNLAYQGNFKRKTLALSGIPDSEFTIDKLEYYGGISFLKSGLVYSEVITTVSPNYSKEIQTELFGCGMHGILNKRKNSLFGILNGIDYTIWNPEMDESIAHKFSKNKLKLKEICKEDLQKQCGLQVDKNALLIGSVSRLDPQKGFDLIINVLSSLLKKKIQFVGLGQGDKNITKQLKDLHSRFPDKISINFDFNDPLAHKIYAGCDVFLMPSKFEPCGLSQMISMAYGTVPIVSKTGGLTDTVTQFNEEDIKGNGFVFYPINEINLRNTLKDVLKHFKKKTLWKKIVKNALSSYFTWKKSTKNYMAIYKIAIDARSKD